MKRNNIKLHAVAAIAVAALASACSSDAVTDALENNTGKAETVTLVASQPGNDTRVGFTEEGKGYWQANDAIGVWSKGDNKFNSFALASSAGEATATFIGTVVNGVGDYAVYPYNEKHSLQDNVLTYYLPEEYTYTSVDQTFFPENKDGKSFCMPMLGTISGGYVVTFSHLAGVVCLQIDKMPAESGTVKVTEASNKLCGTFTANLTDTNPEIKTAESSADKSMTFTYSGATADKPGIFYLPVASGSYNLTVEVASAKKSSTTSVSVEMVCARLQVVNVVTNYEYVINGHKFVDLGLPSGLLWAEANVDAKTAYDDGGYYAWGETSTKNSYTLGNYSSVPCYCSLAAENDVATTKWGSDCRMPTQSEMSELCNKNNCTWTWVSCKNSAGENIDCYKVVSVKNGNFIYLPASGYREDESFCCQGLYGYYWSRTIGENTAYFLNFGDNFLYVYNDTEDYNNHYGFTVRPVAEP